jgi:hypothetical protein
MAARACLTNFFPVTFLLVVGVLLRAGLSACGWFRPRDGSLVRVFPRTSRGWLASVAGVAVLITTLRWVSFDRETVYAPGFDQARFDRIGMGTPAVEVEAALGPPLTKYPAGDDGVEVWHYTTGATGTSDYWRRWIFMKDGRVESLVDDYWYD